MSQLVSISHPMPIKPILSRKPVLTRICSVAWITLAVCMPVCGQSAAVPPTTVPPTPSVPAESTSGPAATDSGGDSKPPYSADVVAKADQVFAAAGLKRSGKMIIATDSIDLNRRIAGLAKSRRTIKQLADAAKQTASELAYVREQFRSVDAQNGELNAQLAAVRRDVLQNNRLVGLINANQSKLRQLDDQRTALTGKLATDRKTLSDGESQYSDAVFAIRRDLSELQRRLEKSLEEPTVKIAIGVYRTNFQTPESIDIGGLIGPVDRRLKQVEKEIFNESIPMEVSEGGAFLVNVSVGDSSVPMILDSGASVICLPAETATRLGITIPPGAPQMKLSLADGRSIDARGVVLPKVRVGGFEAENVDAAILAPSAISPEPLLGLSFLGNFRFEIDAPGKSLKLLRVGE